MGAVYRNGSVKQPNGTYAHCAIEQRDLDVEVVLIWVYLHKGTL